MEFGEFMKVCQTIFEPMKLLIAECGRIRQLRQKEGQSLEDFTTEIMETS
jgi:hypothetical protein